MSAALDIPEAFRRLEDPIADLLNSALVAVEMTAKVFGGYDRREGQHDLYRVSSELSEAALWSVLRVLAHARDLHGQYHADPALPDRAAGTAST